MKVQILFSDTGGGHRAAAIAIQEAMARLRPEVEVRMTDALVEGGVWPLSRAPALYAWSMRHADWTYALTFHLWNGPLRSKLMVDLPWPLTGWKMRRLLAAQDADVLVSVHPLLTRVIARALRQIGRRTPFAVVVTDLVSGHWSWLDAAIDRLFVPTDAWLPRARRMGIPDDRVVLAGQPVHPRCAEALADRERLREAFGWREPVVLMLGGGDGVGDLGRRVRAAARAGLPARVVAVCGRNEALRAELAAETWPGPVEIHGFVRNLHELMAAADVLVTKGGPGTIMEGCTAGLPLLVYSYLPGQETGNVRLIEERGAGRYLPDDAALVAQLRAWIADPGARAEAGARARALAAPDAAFRIARGIFELAEG